MFSSTKNYIAIDLGATSGRVILARLGKESLEIETLHRFPTPLVYLDEKYYWNIYSIYDDILKGLKIAASKGLKIESIGVDTWGVDFVCVAKDGSFCALPRSYRDPYTVDIPEKFFRKMSREELYSRTGIQIMNFNSVFQLYALGKEKSSALSNAKSILFMPDAISYMLTGKKVCEYTILSTSSLMDPRRKSLDKKVLSACGVSARRFPPIIYPGKVIGKLSEALAIETGLGRVPVMAVAGHDTASAVAAVPASDKGFAYLSSGTWSLMGIETSEPLINDSMYEMNFTNEGGVGGTTRVLKNICGMWLLEQCLKKWSSEGRVYDYGQLASMALACPKSSDVIDPDDPMFATPTDMPAAIRAYCSNHGLAEPVGDAAMIRLVLDSLVAKYALVFKKLREIAPFHINALHIIGGGSRNDLLNQMTADACRVRVIAGPSEATAIGNVMLQAGLDRTAMSEYLETKVFEPRNV